MFLILTSLNAVLVAADYLLLRSFSPFLPLILSINFFASIAAISYHRRKFSFSKTSHEKDFLRVAGACVISTLLLIAVPLTISLPASFCLAALISLRWTSAEFRSKAISSLKFDTSFNHVLVADALTSFARPVSASFSTTHIKYLVYSVPFLIRVKQCLQDKRPSSKYNLAKYLLLLTSAYILFNRSWLPMAALAIPVLTAIYASWWDTVMDWGYSKSYISFLPVAVNVAIRLVPIFAPTLHPLIVGGLEVYRRAFWSHLRLLCQDRMENIYRTI